MHFAVTLSQSTLELIAVTCTGMNTTSCGPLAKRGCCKNAKEMILCHNRFAGPCMTFIASSNRTPFLHVSYVRACLYGFRKGFQSRASPFVTLKNISYGAIQYIFVSLCGQYIIPVRSRHNDTLLVRQKVGRVPNWDHKIAIYGIHGALNRTSTGMLGHICSLQQGNRIIGFISDHNMSSTSLRPHRNYCCSRQLIWMMRLRSF